MKTGFEWVDFTWSKFLFILRSVSIPHYFLLGTYYRTRLWLTALIKLKKWRFSVLLFWVNKYVRVGAIFKNWDIKDHHSTMTSFLSSWATIATVAFSERRKIWENWNSEFCFTQKRKIKKLEFWIFSSSVGSKTQNSQFSHIFLRWEKATVILAQLLKNEVFWGL